MYFEYLGSCKKKLQKLQKLALFIRHSTTELFLFSTELIKWYPTKFLITVTSQISSHPLKFPSQLSSHKIMKKSGHTINCCNCVVYVAICIFYRNGRQAFCNCVLANAGHFTAAREYSHNSASMGGIDQTHTQKAIVGISRIYCIL